MGERGAKEGHRRGRQGTSQNERQPAIAAGQRSVGRAQEGQQRGRWGGWRSSRRSKAWPYLLNCWMEGEVGFCRVEGKGGKTSDKGQAAGLT